jgi:hypothetical protein
MNTLGLLVAVTRGNMTIVMAAMVEAKTLLELLATASLARQDVERRSLWHELSERCNASLLPRPNTSDATLLAFAAASAEMLAEQQGVLPPAWTATVGAVPGEPLYLDSRNTALGRKRLADESPEPLRSRGFYASAKYVSFV